MIGESRAMRRVIGLIEQVAPTSASVIITGESGTGKEEVARAIHNRSQRPRAPLIGINCAAIPESLVESQLFGHERGSFTGADRRHEGCFERAHSGTLPLDEITEMRPDVQAKLLRVLEEHESFAWAATGRYLLMCACSPPPIVRWTGPCVTGG